ncbi:MAG: NAD(P)H-dependent oxidoreductase [Capnocytophaga sp.]|nr:NAD(P)H-dependent oxidoreductase [Capnocytophaga sp.]
MNFLELAKNRYTTKSYRTEKISEAKIQELKEILRLAPSSINSQPWKFYFIDNQETKQKLAKVSFMNEERIQQASHLVVFSVINDIELFENQLPKYIHEGAVAFYKQNVKSHGEEAVKNWLARQVYISLGYFLTACATMGIDSTPMEGIDNQKYNEILGLKEYHTFFAVAIGYRNPEDSNQPLVQPKQRLPLEKIIG